MKFNKLTLKTLVIIHCLIITLIPRKGVHPIKHQAVFVNLEIKICLNIVKVTRKYKK